MKFRLLLLLTLISSSAFAGEANTFSCKGEGVNVQVTLSNAHGRPSLEVEATDSSSVNTPGGRLEKVSVIDTAMGLQVSGEFIEIADATLKYTLIVPHMIVNALTPVMTGNAMLVRSMTGGYIPPTSELARVVENNKFTSMICQGWKI